MENPATPPAVSLLEYRNEAEGFATMPKPPGAEGPFDSRVNAPVLVSTLNTKTLALLVANRNSDGAGGGGVVPMPEELAPPQPTKAKRRLSRTPAATKARTELKRIPSSDYRDPFFRQQV
jgi:hypothetical protein